MEYSFMKKVIVFAFFFISCSNVFGQNAASVTFNQLIQLQAMTISEFEDFALSHGFETAKTDYNPTACSYFGFNSINNESTGARAQLSLTICYQANPIAAFATTNRDYYLRIKAILKEKGYSHVRIEPSSNSEISPFQVYSNNIFEVKLYTYKIHSNVFYNIAINRKP
jgi:hypothetical protein